MTKAQKELIREAYAKEVDGEGWRKRMERWLDEKRLAYWMDMADSAVVELLSRPHP